MHHHNVTDAKRVNDVIALEGIRANFSLWAVE